MNCLRCGAEIGEDVRSCPNCALPAAPPLFRYVDGAQEEGKKKVGMVLAVGAAAGLLVMVLALAGVGRKLAIDANSGAAPDKAAPGSTQPVGPVNFPELHFASSGKLPNKLHIFQIGMTVADAISADPTLKDQRLTGQPGSPQPASDPNALLCCGDSSSGFTETADFTGGRLVDALSVVSGISSEDASDFDRNTIRQLGNPDIKVLGGPSAVIWVWVDGDLRIRYENRPDDAPIGSREVTLEMAVYPLVINIGSRAAQNSPWIGTLRRHWGDTSEKVVVKALPIELSGLRLRMTPWQVRSALPGLNLVRIDEHQQQGEVDVPGSTTQVAFWNGELSSFSKIREDVPADQVPGLRQHLIDDLGTPSNDGADREFETLTWEDNRTIIDYLFSAGKSANLRTVQVSYRDKQLQALYNAEQAARHPREFNPAPVEHSFF